MIQTLGTKFETFFNTTIKDPSNLTERVVGIYSALNDSVVVLTHCINKQQIITHSVLYHFLSNGQIRELRKDQKPHLNSYEICMMKDDEILVCPNQFGYFRLIPLRKGQQSKLINLMVGKHKEKAPEKCQHYTYIFSQSKMLAVSIVQPDYQGFYYYYYPFLDKQYGPDAVWKWAVPYYAQRFDDKGKLGWLENAKYNYGFRRNFKLTFIFAEYDSKTSSVINSKFTTVNSLFDCFNIPQINLSYPNVRQINPNRYLVHACAMQDEFSYKQPNKQNPPYTNCFEIYVDCFSNQGIIVNSDKGRFLRQSDTFSSLLMGNWIIYNIDNRKKYSVIEDNQFPIFVTYYMSIFDDDFVLLEESDRTISPFYEVTNYDLCTIMTVDRIVKENGVEESMIKMSKYRNRKVMHFHCLMHLNEDFDDNLLEDAMKLLDN